MSDGPTEHENPATKLLESHATEGSSPVQKSSRMTEVNTCWQVKNSDLQHWQCLKHLQQKAAVVWLPNVAYDHPPHLFTPHSRPNLKISKQILYLVLKPGSFRHF